MNVISKIASWYFQRNSLPYWGILAVDSMLIIFSGLLANYLVCGASAFIGHFWSLLLELVVMQIPFFIGFKLFHTYSGIIRYSSFVDLGRVFLANLVGVSITYLAFVVFPHGLGPIISVKALLYILLIGTLLLWLVRVVVKIVFDTYSVSQKTYRVFIYGTRHGGISVAKSIRNDVSRKYIVKGFVTPDVKMKGKYLMGEPVFIDDDQLVHTMRMKNITRIIVSPWQADHFRTREQLINELINNNIKIKMMPEIENLDINADLQHYQFHEVEIEDLLPRERIDIDMDSIASQLRDKVVLITGAAGSIGSEMVHQVALFNPRKMILVDQAETPMHDIRLMMARKFPTIDTVFVVASITNTTCMEQLFADHRPDYVFHAAAYKHVPMMEDNPAMAVQNNVLGTHVIADLAVKYGTKKFVMVSTDKAVNPTNVMGCSKRICEIYCQSLNKAIAEGGTDAPLTQVDGTPAVTQFVTTRFGNVLGSNGSVIPLFREQIKRGGPITVTHPDIIRYFMLIPEACKLVLEAGTIGHGGEIFVFDMGKPVKIVDLAKRMIALSHAPNVKIEFTGLREGEKLFEEVLNDAEQTKPTKHPKIMVASVREYDYKDVLANEERLIRASYTYDDMAIVRIMKEIVPEYISNNSKYSVLDS
ncbi:MAG: polysaccharide biosynthesis protein [Bacteroidaceae bacterium]|nr:polysaccharide biosynthesis protein [Bacteroidaceae bacterium]